MIGKRVIQMKRPAVLYAAAFVLGIVLRKLLGRSAGGDSAWPAVGIAGGLFLVSLSFVRSLHKGKRRVSAADRLLLLVPCFLLCGYFVMYRETAAYTKNASAFAACMESGREVLTEGTVSRIRRTGSGIRLELENARAAPYSGEETVYSPVGKLLIYTEDIFAENGELKHGQQIVVYGKGSTFDEASNPGGFDAKTYYFSLGIAGAVQGTTIRITDASYHRLNQALFQAKSKLLNHYITYLGEEGAGVISSMLLGERTLVSEDTKELYRRGGISHILAISGLHVSMIGMALYEGLRKTILGRNGAIPAACAGVVLYGTFVEAGTSTKRAVIMFLLLLLATALGRTYDTLSAMSVSVIVILWKSPGALYTASFQLSYAAAYGASVLAVLLREREKDQLQGKKLRQMSGAKAKTVFAGTAEQDAIEEAVRIAKRTGSKWVRWYEFVKEKIRTKAIFGLAIQAVTFPFTVYHFFEYPTYGFLLNPVVVPLMTVLLLCGLLCGVCGLLVPWAGYFFAGGARGILWIYESLCRWMEKLPGSLLLFGRPTVWQIGAYFALLALCLYLRKRFRLFKASPGRQRAVYVFLLGLPLCLLPLPEAKFEAVFLDVGQGDGIILRERGGAVLLVDGGSTSVQNVGEKRMIPYLKSQGIRVIDCAFVSHTDSDHISGMKEILEAMPFCSVYSESIAGYSGTPVIKSIVLPELYEEDAELSKQGKRDAAYSELKELAREKNVKIYSMRSGDRMKVGKKLDILCLAPEEGIVYTDKNAASMVLLATYGEFDMLLTGDMDKAGEARLLKQGVFGEALAGTRIPGSETIEVLKVAHHGSHTASSEEFITAVRPQISIISCGKDNRYGHPHEETLGRLQGAGTTVYRTDETGAIEVRIKRDKIKILVYGDG